MLEEYKIIKLEEKKTFYEEVPKNAEEMQDTQAIKEQNLEKDEAPREKNSINFSDDERSTNSITNKDNISEFNNIVPNNHICKKNGECDESSEINFDAIATLSIIYRPKARHNHNNLVVPNQLQPKKNLKGKKDGIFEKEAKKEKFG